jgi:hypothetical protein
MGQKLCPKCGNSMTVRQLLFPGSVKYRWMCWKCGKSAPYNPQDDRNDIDGAIERRILNKTLHKGQN